MRNAIKNKNSVIIRHYPVPTEKRQKVRSELTKLEKLGIIEPAISEFCNPLRIVVKIAGIYAHVWMYVFKIK